MSEKILHKPGIIVFAEGARPGDTVEVEIEEIGMLGNRVQEE